MSATIDERIVAAKFDASDFEKGVNKTIKKLDELKKSLDLKDATKSVKEFAEKTEVSTDSMNKSLEKLTDRFTSFTGMIKQQILGGLAEEVSSVFLKMEQSVVSFIKSISSAQVGVGMQKYEQMLTSVRVMMSAGETEQNAYKAIDDLRNYSDQTSYSLSQMTDALSKFKSAGVDLDVATKSVEGIANACASAGVNATDAAHAFFNLSQAYTKGNLRYEDYRSLELLNMTTEKFKEQMLDAAVAAETLKKTGEGVYQTINKKDKKVIAGKKVTKENLQDMLRYNFMTKDAMNKLFGDIFFFDQKKWQEAKEKYGDDLEAIKKEYGAVAVESYLAAREARNFTDVFNTLRDVISTGWSTTFEHFFGKLEKATEFFTKLVEDDSPLFKAIYKIGEYRNAILGFWDGGLDGTGGGEVFRQTILNIADALGILLKTVLQILPGFDEIFDDAEDTPVIESLGDKMFMLSMKIRDVSDKIKQAAENFNIFMNSPIMENGPTRIELIRQILGNLSSVLTIIGKVALIAMNGISKAFYTLSPIFDGLLIVLDKITAPLSSLKNDDKVFKDIEHSINNILTVLTPVAETIGTILGFLGEVAGFFAQMAIDTVTSNITFLSDALGLLLELFGVKSDQLKEGEGVLDSIRKDFEGIKDACTQGLGALNEFFTSLLDDLKKLFGLTEEAEGEDGGLFSGLTNFFETNQFVQDAKAWVNQAIIDVGDFIKSIPEKIKTLGANIFDTLYKLFFTEETKHNGSQLETKTVLTPLGEWCDQAIKDIKAFIISLPQRIISGIGKVGNWIDTIFNEFFGHKEYKEINKSGETYNVVESSKFEYFVGSTISQIKEWFNDLPNKIRKGMANIGDFFSKVINVVDEFLFGKKIQHVEYVGDKNGKKSVRLVTTRYKTGFSKFLAQIIDEVKKFIVKIPEYITSAIKGAGDIITAIINALFGKNDGEKADSKDVEEKLEEPFSNINLTTIINKIKEIGKEILNQIARIFTGSEDIETNQAWFSEKIAQGIEWIRVKAKLALDVVLDFIKNLPTKIANLFTDEDSKNQEQGPIGKAISDFGTTIAEFIKSIPSALATAFTEAINQIDLWWQDLYTALSGGGEKAEETKELDVDAITGAAPIAKKSKWDEFVESLGKMISTAFEKLPVWIAQGIHIAINGINDLIGSVTDWINGATAEEVQKAAEEASKAATEATEQITDDTKKAAEDATKDEEDNKFIEAIKGIGLALYNVITKTIPSFISAAWKGLGLLGSKIFEGISEIFSGDMDDAEKDKTATNASDAVKKSLKETLPGKIAEVWANIKSKASQVFNGFASIFTGSEPQTEIEKAVNQFGTTIYNFIVTDIPNAIKKAFDFIAGLFKKKDPYDVDLSYLSDAERAYVERYIDSFRKADERRKAAEPEQSFAEGFKTSILSAFESIGPAVLNGLATALSWVSKIAMLVINVLTGKTSIGDEIEAAYGKEQPELKSALTNIGESLKTFFLETIPAFIGSAIGTLIKEAPKWFDTLFGAMRTASEESEKEAFSVDGPTQSIDGAVDSATGVLGTVSDFIKKIGNFITSDVTATVALVLGFALLLGALKDLFSVSKEVDAVAGTIKWTAIAIAVAGLAAFLSSITALVSSDDPKKVEDAMTLLDKLGSLMGKIAEIVKWISGSKGAISLFDTISNFAKRKQTIVAMGSSGSILGGNVSGFFGSVLSILGIGAGTDIASGMFSAAIDTFLSTVSDAFTSLASGIDDAFSYISPLIDDLVKINDDVDTAIDSIGKIKSLFETLFGAFEELYEDATGGMIKEVNGNAVAQYVTETSNGETVAGPTKLITYMGGFMKELQKRIDLYLTLANFMEKLSRSLHNIASIENIEETFRDLIKVINSDEFEDIFTNLFDKLHSAYFESNMGNGSYDQLTGNENRVMDTLAVGLEILSNALNVFATSITGINESNIGAVDHMLKIFGLLIDAVGDTKFDDNSLAKILYGNNTLASIGRQIKEFGRYVKIFYGNISDMPGFKEDEIEETNRKVKSITELIRQFALAMQDMLKYGSSSDLLDDLGRSLPSFGDAVGKFFTKLDTAMPKNITSERASILYEATKSMSEMINAVKNLGDLLITFSSLDVSKIMEKVFTGMSDDVNANKFAALIRVFHDAIQEAFDSDPDMTLKITPVLTFDPDEIKQQLNNGLGFDVGTAVDWPSLVAAISGANNQTDADRVKASELYPKIDAISRALSTDGIIIANGTSVADLTNAFSSMKIVTDTGALVAELTPGIDDEIGKRIWYVQNNITPP